MNSATKRNIAYIGLLSGLLVALICLLTPFARGMMVWYQLLVVILAGGTIGYVFRNKIENSIVVSVFGVIFTLGATRVFSFINENTPLVFALMVAFMGALFFLLSSKFFGLKMNNLLKCIIAIILFFIWFFFIPIMILYLVRVTYI